MDRAFIEYAVNAAWQLPVLAVGAWLLIRTARPAAAAQHRIWVAVLALAVALPGIGLLTQREAHVNLVPANSTSAPASAASTHMQSLAAQPANTGSISRTEATLASLLSTHQVEISTRTARWIVGVYLLVLLLGLMRILRAWSGARRLVGRSLNAALTRREQALVANCAHRMKIRPPQIRTAHHADALPGPAVIGAARPVLLCPNEFLRALLESGREEDAAAALCHEMAHIRRHDYAVNLICEVLAIPLRWHPVTYGVTRQIRQTREMACDAAAAHAIESQVNYARSLVRLARQTKTGALLEQPGALGLFHGNALEERVMQLIEKQTRISLRAKVARCTAGGAVMAAAVTLAAMCHVVPARAQAAPATVHATPTAPAPPAQPAARPSPAVLPQAHPSPPAKPAPPAVPQAHPTPPTQPKAMHHDAVIVSKHGKVYAWSNSQMRELTPAERARIQKQLERAKQQLAKQKALLNSPEFKERIEKAERQAVMAQRKLQSGEIQKQLAQAKKQLAQAEARINSPEFKEQLERAQREAMEAQRKLRSGEIQKQLAQARKQMAQAQEQLQKQMDQLKKQQQQLQNSNPGPNRP